MQPPLVRELIRKLDGSVRYITILCCVLEFVFVHYNGIYVVFITRSYTFVSKCRVHFA